MLSVECQPSAEYMNQTDVQTMAPRVVFPSVLGPAACAGDVVTAVSKAAISLWQCEQEVGV